MQKTLPVELLERYINGECTDVEVALVKEWYASFEHHATDNAHLTSGEEIALREHIYNRILNRIDAPEDAEVVTINKRRGVQKWWYAIAGAAAAIAALVININISHYHSNTAAALKSADVEAAPLIDIKNNSDQIYKATLPDHSSVWLSPHAQLQYPKVFTGLTRQVSMSGECFFEVTKNPQRPFIIQSRSIITKVWGTSFRVRDDAKGYADVSVLTGKVSVRAKNPAEGVSSALKLEKGEVMLYPHQKVVYGASQPVLKPQVCPKPELQQWSRVNLSFDNKPLSEIIPVLDAKFHVQIKTDREQLKRYILNADMTGFNLSDVLEALKKSLNISYGIKDQTIELK